MSFKHKLRVTTEVRVGPPQALVLGLVSEPKDT